MASCHLVHLTVLRYICVFVLCVDVCFIQGSFPKKKCGNQIVGAPVSSILVNKCHRCDFDSSNTCR